MIERIFHLHALSALHVGTGQSVGVVDLPIARARATNLPLVPGSAIKGVLRDDLQLDLADKITLFGPESTADSGHAGAIAVGDAHLLILPIRAFSGIVAFATCPFILARYGRDTGLSFEPLKLADDQAATPDDSTLPLDGKVLLEDLDLKALAKDTATAANQWAEEIAKRLHPDDEDWQALFKQHFVILPDSIFSFLADTATEIRARIKIDDATRVVQRGALWYEENLPAESVLWGVIGISKARDKSGKMAEELAALLPGKPLDLQIGGKHTVGRGLCRLVVKGA